MRWSSTVETMPFGKYVGWAIEDVPTDYLRWCLRTLTRLGPDLRRAMMDVVGEPLEDTPPAGSAGMPRAADVLALVNRVCRAATLRHHPDRGGSVAAMQAVNAIRDELERAVREEFGE